VLYTVEIREVTFVGANWGSPIEPRTHPKLPYAGTKLRNLNTSKGSIQRRRRISKYTVEHPCPYKR